ncbi:MAG: hypothetical protein HZB87_05480 [Desulfatitalea sp.]|nr:hypothetical protein [Desulfatitalea sp.]
MKILIVDDEMAALTKMKVLLGAFGESTLCTGSQQAFVKKGAEASPDAAKA